MEPNEPQSVERILGWLLKSASSNWQKNPHEYALANQLIGPTFPPFRNYAELKSVLQRAPDQFESLASRKFLWLEPVRRGTLAFPLMAIEYDYRSSFPILSLRVGVFLHNAPGATPEERCIGYRFEGPEGEGNHNYYHVQHITAFAKNSVDLQLPSPSWIPVSQPAIPLDADGPVSLVINALVALYGKKVLDRLREAEPKLWDVVRPRIELLLARLVKFAPAYYEVRDAGGKIVCYRTWFEEAVFKPRAAEAHPKAEINATSVGTWSTSEHRQTI